MTVIGLMHIGWFTSNLLTALSRGTVQQMFQEVWTFADMSFGFGGLIIGIGTISAAHWARSSGIVLCLLAASSNLLWFSDYFDRGLPRPVLFGHCTHLAIGHAGGLSVAVSMAPLRSKRSGGVR